MFNSLLINQQKQIVSLNIRISYQMHKSHLFSFCPFSTLHTLVIYTIAERKKIKSNSFREKQLNTEQLMNSFSSSIAEDFQNGIEIVSKYVFV